MAKANQTPEQAARHNIDGMLEQAGWKVQSKDRIDFGGGLGIAVREYQTDIGHADYVLFVNKKAAGVIEAKPEDWGQNITKVEAQSGGYAAARLKWLNNHELLPFVYESTVAKIEELFSELDKGVENLEKAREQLKVYRQAVLKHAFEGKLTAQWREENKDKLENREQLLTRIRQERRERHEMQIEHWNTAVKTWEEAGRSGKKPAKPRKSIDIAHSPNALSDKLPDLPEGWIWVRVGSICEVVRGGSPRPAGDTRYYGGTIPFLKVADLTRTAGAYIETHSYSIKEAGLNKTRLIDPPVLMLSNSGATLGVPKICRIRTTFNDGIAALLGLDENDLPYHYYFWVSKTSELRAINQGAAQPNLNTGLIQDVTIPLCSKEEMQIVARDIGGALSICDQLNADIDAQIARSEALRQSILKKAFSGQLVAQDPNDEPATALLERIKAEKVAQSRTAKLREKRRRARATA